MSNLGKFLLALVFSFSSTFTYLHAKSISKKEMIDQMLASESYESTFLFPLDIKNKSASLSVSKDYKCISNATSEKKIYLEFIPKNETTKNWSEMVVIQQLPHAKIKSFMELFAQEMEKSVKKAASITSFSEEPALVSVQQSGVDVMFFSMEYPSMDHEAQGVKLIKGKVDFLVCKAVAGKNDVWLVQFTKRFDRDKIAEKDLEQAKNDQIGHVNALFIVI